MYYLSFLSVIYLLNSIYPVIYLFGMESPKSLVGELHTYGTVKKTKYLLLLFSELINGFLDSDELMVQS